jgi:hypothetical protein
MDLDLNLCPVQPFSTLLVARLGNGIATNQLMKMVAGAINPGRPVANLYVSFYPMRTMNCLLASSTNFNMAVLDVEPRRCGDINWPRQRPQVGPVPQDPPSRDVPHPGMGYDCWQVIECLHQFSSLC